MSFRYVRAFFIVLACSFLAAQPILAAEIWIGTDEPEWRKQNRWLANDYFEMFQPDAAWPIAAANTVVFHITKRFAFDSPDDEFRLVVDGLKQRHIKIALQGTPLPASKSCGLGVEGYGPPDDMLVMAKRFKAFGTTVDYVAMDEPLWFGHEWNGNANSKIIPCHSSISEVAQQTAVKMKAVREVFPNVKIGDIEPMGINANLAESWKSDISEWMDAYQREMGTPLAFFQLDVVWLNPTWQSILLSSVKSAKDRNIPLGIIYNGTPKDQTDEDWVRSAESHFMYVENIMQIHPAQAFFFSWMDHPREMLPETTPGTLTNLVFRYVNWRSKKR